MRIACLHTAESNVAVFEAAAREIGLLPGVLCHDVRADLLLAAERAGGLTPQIAETTNDALLPLAKDVNAVILTCSTLGASIDSIAATGQVPVLRVDAALARAAVAEGGKVVVLCTVESTIELTSRLFLDAAREFGALVEVRLIPQAWAIFKSGNLTAYLACIAEVANSAYAEGASIVALAQASMAGAAPLVWAGPKPFTSPSAGLTAALAAAKKTQG